MPQRPPCYMTNAFEAWAGVDGEIDREPERSRRSPTCGTCSSRKDFAGQVGMSMPPGARPAARVRGTLKAGPAADSRVAWTIATGDAGTAWGMMGELAPRSAPQLQRRRRTHHPPDGRRDDQASLPVRRPAPGQRAAAARTWYPHHVAEPLEVAHVSTSQLGLVPVPGLEPGHRDLHGAEERASPRRGMGADGCGSPPAGNPEGRVPPGQRAGRSVHVQERQGRRADRAASDSRT